MKYERIIILLILIATVIYINVYTKEGIGTISNTLTVTCGNGLTPLTSGNVIKCCPTHSRGIMKLTTDGPYYCCDSTE